MRMGQQCLVGCVTVNNLFHRPIAAPSITIMELTLKMNYI